jgi:tRNA modification GTPase
VETPTIVAVATPAGRGGIGCVRLSGAASVEIAQALFEPSHAEPALQPGEPPRFGRFLGRERRPLDHGYLVVFAEGNSFTGELTVELWTHGSPAVLEELIAAALAAGADAAGPGEFTYRAVLSGRLDLTRAEAIRDLIEARTLYQARVAFAQAEGSLARKLRPLTDALEDSIARGEAAVEFVEESETHMRGGELTGAIDSVLAGCVRLLADFAGGRIVRDGAALAMIGLPNVGKSSLFNRLLDRERAIVTDRPGTTRDTLEEEFNLAGIPVRLIDTAGLREVDDAIESEGVRRAEQAREEADLVLVVLDASVPYVPEQSPVVEGALVVWNKCDLPFAPANDALYPDAARLSALNGDGIDALRSKLRERLVGSRPAEDPIVTNRRHARALEQARDALERARESGRQGLSDELLLEDVREARRHLGTITGEFDIESMYDRIFSTFCIGK